MVVDELIVILGLDPRKFNEGQRDALAAFKKTSEEATKFGKGIEQQGQKLGDMFGIIKGGAMGIVGAFVGGGAAAFVDKMINMDAATGRFAKTIGTSVENLSTWQGMIRQLGGEAGAATSTLSSLQQVVENFRQNGGALEPGFVSLANQAGVNVWKDSPDAILRKIHSFISGSVESGKMRPDQAGTFLRRIPGINEDMVNLLLSNTKAFQDYEAAAKKAGIATDGSVSAAQRLQTAFALLMAAIENAIRIIMPLLELLTMPIKDIPTKGVEKLTDFGNRAFGNADGTPFSFTPGSPMDRLFRWQYKKLYGNDYVDPSQKPGPDLSGIARPRLAAPARRGSAKSYSDDEAVREGLYDEPGSPAAAALKAEADRLRRGGTDLPSGAGAAAVNRSIINHSSRRSSTSTSDVTIGSIHVNAPNATDADGIAGEIGPALKRSSLIAPANTGLV